MQPDFDFDLNRRKKDMAAATIVYYAKRISLILPGFNPNQPRDDQGRWADTGTTHKPLSDIQLVDAGNSQVYTKPVSNFDGNGACYEQCKHLMYIGHGNEYRACYLRCLRQN